jgi:succinate dehydrogenase/fumarate reductase flavoprotein subunit
LSISIHECDVLVAGAGAAGMRAALEAAEHGMRTVLVCKSLLGKASTVLAAGSIAARSEEAEARVGELERWGALLERDREGRAHRGDRTGLEVLRALQHRLAQSSVAIHMECPVRRLVLEDNRISGALAIRRRDGEFIGFRTSAVVLATGGGAAAWKRSSAPGDATGDGVALGLAAGARIARAGGVETDPRTAASRVAGLYAAGEAAAGRVEGNGISEALVLGCRAGRHAAEYVRRPARRVSPTLRFEASAHDLDTYFRREGKENPYLLRAELGECMDDLAGPVRSAAGLRHAHRILADLKARLAGVGVTGSRAYNPAWHEALDMESLLAFSRSVVLAALETESEWQKNGISVSGAATPAAATSRAIAS